MGNLIKTSARNWYLGLLLGLIVIAVSIWVIITPLESHIKISFFFAVTFLMIGILEIEFAIETRGYVEGWGWSLAGGVVETLIGLLLVSRPDITMSILSFYIGFAVLFRSGMAIGQSIELSRQKLPNWGWLFFMGILGVIFTFILTSDTLFAGFTIVVCTDGTLSHTFLI